MTLDLAQVDMPNEQIAIIALERVAAFLADGQDS